MSSFPPISDPTSDPLSKPLINPSQGSSTQSSPSKSTTNSNLGLHNRHSGPNSVQKYQSLDFTRVLNSYNTSTSSSQQKRTIIGYSGRTFVRWFLTLICGVFTGVVSIFIVWCIDRLTDLREKALRQNEESGSENLLLAFIGFTSWNLGLAVLASILSLSLAPMSLGSGIPEVKAYLNGINIKGFFSSLTFAVKIIGTVLSVSSGLAVGPEGPLVHLGGAIGGGLTRTGRLMNGIRWIRKKHPTVAKYLGCSKNGCTTKFVSYMSALRNDGERRDFISIGSACRKPLPYHFPSRMLWRTLVGTSLATFMIAIYFGDLTKYGVLTLDSIDTPNDDVVYNRFAEIPWYALIGTMGGLIGAAFNAFWRYWQGKRSRFYKNKGDLWKIGEVALLSILTSICLFTLPLSWDFVCRSAKDADDDTFYSSSTDSFGHSFNCNTNQTNEMASIFFGSREEAIKNILKNPDEFDERTLLITGLTFLILLSLTFGSAIPSGIFMPTILIGSSLGGYAGIIIKRIPLYSNMSTSTFALVGAAALLGGIQRSAVSLCVIIMEGTGETKFLLPIVVTTVCAKWVGDNFNHGIYEIGMELKNYPYLEHHVHRSYDQHSVGEVMSRDVTCLRGVEKAETIEAVLNDTSYNGFPVVSQAGNFLGIVRRDQLVAMLESCVFIEGEEGGAPAVRAASDENNARSSGWQQIRDESPPNTLTRSNSDETEFKNGLRRNLSFVTNPNIAAIAMGNDCKWGTISTDAGDKNNNTKKKDDPLLPLSTPPRHSDIFDSVYHLKDDKYLEVVDPEVELSPADRVKLVDIKSVMNVSPHVVLETCPLSVAYRLFTNIGLRHLVVLGGGEGGREEDLQGRVVGIVTRLDLLEETLHDKLN
ncbi:hypothetical protein TL16_g11308 [Triparma laevis f. inornata]|uniref:Chloride channel protein n=1 Tax=Triparma laevis f. inornata TaxID=1714386 RepID=A0A9W7BDC1_9STRA|nr:hypothetical protein TL16_g11308 [Triparma laevis f. inornata]